MFDKTKLNSIETLIFQALIDLDVSHKEVIRILKKKDKYERMKDNLKNKNGELYEIMRYYLEKQKTVKYY